MICSNDKQQTKKLRSSLHSARDMHWYEGILCVCLMEWHQHMERVQRKHEQFLFVVIKRKYASKRKRGKKGEIRTRKEKLFAISLCLCVCAWICVRSFFHFFRRSLSLSSFPRHFEIYLLEFVYTVHLLRYSKCAISITLWKTNKVEKWCAQCTTEHDVYTVCICV